MEAPPSTAAPEPEVETVRGVRVEIEAPASLVWEVLLDLPRYAEWNSFNPSIESTLEPGAAVVMQARNLLNGSCVEVTEYLVAREPERRLAWEQPPARGSADAARRDQMLEALGPGRCAFEQTDRFFGPGAAAVLREHGAWVKAGFDRMAFDLKRRAEQLQAARGRAAATRSD